MLSTAVELKWAPWALWIQDLAVADPYWVLPIVMGATQIVQQKMTLPPPDPFQKRMMQFLPVVFTVFSLGFPSGLGALLADEQRFDHRSANDLQPDQRPGRGGRRPGGARQGEEGIVTERTRRFSGAILLAQAVMSAARYHRIDPERLAYRFHESGTGS